MKILPFQRRKGQIDPLFGAVFIIMLLLMISQSQQLTKESADEHGQVGVLAFQLQDTFDIIFGRQSITCPFLSPSSLLTLWNEKCYEDAELDGTCVGCIACRQGDKCYVKDVNDEKHMCHPITDDDTLIKSYELSCSEILEPESRSNISALVSRFKKTISGINEIDVAPCGVSIPEYPYPDLGDGQIYSTTLGIPAELSFSDCVDVVDTTYENNGQCPDIKMDVILSKAGVDGFVFNERDGVGSIVYVDEDVVTAIYPEEAAGDVSAQTKDSHRFMTQKMPSWQCFIIFGALPFIVLYYLFWDLLSFTFLSQTTKKWIAITVSMMAVSMGLLSNVVLQLNEITNLGAGTSFLTLIFSLGLLSALFSQIGGLMQSTANMRAGMVEATEGVSALRSITRSMRGGTGGHP